MYKIYYPYPATDNTYKYFIITSNGKKIRFGRKSYDDYTIHKNEERKLRYIKRHSKLNENWGRYGVDTAGYWCYKFLWSYPTKEEAYKHIKKELYNWGYITKEQYNQYIF